MKTLILENPSEAKDARHVEGVSFRCHDCRKVIPVQTSGGTGYARCQDPDGEHLVCYACADARQREDLKTGDRFSAYVSSDGKSLTTWTGGVLGTVSLGSVHPWSRGSWAGERHYLRAYDCHGGVWSGTGAPGMYASLRRCKARVIR